MPVIEGGVIIPGARVRPSSHAYSGAGVGSLGPFESAGVPGAGTDEVQTVTVTGTPTGGTFRLRFNGSEPTMALAHNVSGANMQVALRALSTINGANVTVAGNGPYTVTFVADLGKEVQPLLVLSNNLLTGGTTPTVTVVETTPGVSAVGVNEAKKGALCVDVTNADLYINQGTVQAPSWVLVGPV